MFILPTVLITLGSVSGAGGIALTLKSTLESLDVAATNRQTQYQNERNLLRLESVSERLEDSLEELGKQRMIITKNFNVFVNAFEKIHNRPEFSQKEDSIFPTFDFDEIKNTSVIANAFLGASFGVVGGAALAAAATSGTTAAVMAWGTASTGTRIAALHGTAATKAALAALGGGAISAGGGGMALGTLVLNVASIGVGFLVEGIAMAYVGSVARKQADKAHKQMLDNEKIISEAIEMQIIISNSIAEIKKVSVDICNNVYKPLVMEFKELVKRKQDWNAYTTEEKQLVENNILVVQILHFLNNIPLYKATSFNSKGEVDEIQPNKGVRAAVKKARTKSNAIRRNNHVKEL